MLVTTEAIALRARKHGETSKIVVLYTRDFGKVSVIAKGAREMKSKFGGALEMCALSNAVFYKKERHEGLYLLSKCELIRSNAKIMNSLEQIEAATEIVELIVRAMQDEEENQDIFQLLSSTLETLAASDRASATALQIRFYLEFARISGFAMRLRDEEADANDGDSAPRAFERTTIFDLESGEMNDYAVTSKEHEHATYRGIALLPESRAALRFLDGATLEKSASLRLSERGRTQLIDLFNAFFTRHLPGFTSRTMKSGRVFGSL